MDSLPYELLFYIVTNFIHPSDFFNLRSTQRIFRKILPIEKVRNRWMLYKTIPPRKFAVNSGTNIKIIAVVNNNIYFHYTKQITCFSVFSLNTRKTIFRGDYTYGKIAVDNEGNIYTTDGCGVIKLNLIKGETTITLIGADNEGNICTMDNYDVKGEPLAPRWEPLAPRWEPLAPRWEVRRLEKINYLVCFEDKLYVFFNDFIIILPEKRFMKIYGKIDTVPVFLSQSMFYAHDYSCSRKIMNINQRTPHTSFLLYKEKKDEHKFGISRGSPYIVNRAGLDSKGKERLYCKDFIWNEDYSKIPYEVFDIMKNIYFQKDKITIKGEEIINEFKDEHIIDFFKDSYGRVFLTTSRNRIFVY